MFYFLLIIVLGTYYIHSTYQHSENIKYSIQTTILHLLNINQISPLVNFCVIGIHKDSYYK